jgi:uncharacterized DUF497 family protein
VKPVRLTVHAQTVAAQRGIDQAWIEAAAREPEWTEPDQVTEGGERRFRSIAQHGGRILRVVCVESNTEIRIVTVFFDRKAKKPA